MTAMYIKIFSIINSVIIGQTCFASEIDDLRWVNQRADLVEHLSTIGISDERVLDAIKLVPAMNSFQLNGVNLVMKIAPCQLGMSRLFLSRL